MCFVLAHALFLFPSSLLSLMLLLIVVPSIALVILAVILVVIIAVILASRVNWNQEHRTWSERDWIEVGERVQQEVSYVVFKGVARRGALHHLSKLTSPSHLAWRRFRWQLSPIASERTTLRTCSRALVSSSRRKNLASGSSSSEVQLSQLT